MKGNENNKSNNDNTLPPTSYPSAEDESTFPDPPPQIEGYKILGELGKAGQGRVWRALQLSTHREVALKVPRAGLLHSEKNRARFEREVEVAARLNHPNIARIHDSGLHQDRYYYTMELIEGMPLNEYVEQHNLAQRQILELMRTVCQAVQHAHQNAVIHRDIKPSNILVTEDGQPHIVDFGLAKYLPGEDLSKAISIDGEMVGTPAYMSPEQALGEMEKVDTRTDVYSLGAILFFLLTGENPHDLSGSRSKVLQRIAQEEIRRPRRINPKIDKELEALLLKSLDNNPDRRYPSAGDLARDIDNYINSRPLMAKNPTVCYFLYKHLHNYRRVIVIAFSIIIAFGIGLFGSYSVKSMRRWVFQKRIAGKEHLELTFGLYESDNRRKMYRKFDPVIDHIEGRLEYLLERPVDIDIYIFDTYGEAIDALVQGKVDFVRFGPASYIKAKEFNPDIRLIAMELVKGKKMFKGKFIVRKDSDIYDLSDLKGKSFAFGDENSTIGRFLSQVELSKAGVHSGDLKNFDYLGSHDNVAEAVLEGKFDAAAIKEDTFEEYSEEGKGLRCIADFNNVTKPWIARDELDPNVVSAIKKVLLDLKDPEGLETIGVSGFTEVFDSDYNFVRDRMKEAESFFNRKRK